MTSADWRHRATCRRSAENPITFTASSGFHPSYVTYRRSALTVRADVGTEVTARALTEVHHELVRIATAEALLR
jgi:hypothetical protein